LFGGHAVKQKDDSLFLNKYSLIIAEQFAKKTTGQVQLYIYDCHGYFDCFMTLDTVHVIYAYNVKERILEQVETMPILIRKRPYVYINKIITKGQKYGKYICSHLRNFIWVPRD